MAGRRIRWRAVCALATIAAAGTLLASATQAGAMRSTKLGPHLCKTVNGGRFVKIPGFPGERIDRRLLRDIRWMKRKFHVFITDGYSTDPVHAQNGEHPIGLAADIVPNVAKGGGWSDIGDLAHVAEPIQNQPIMPWRWVGWNGDAGHGRGHHLHLSWAHSDTRPTVPARVVYTRRCPRSKGDDPTGDRERGRDRGGRPGAGGGTRPGRGGGGGGGDGNGGTSPGAQAAGSGAGGGGISPKVGRLAPAVPETS
jgi:uncharacterized membrane protein YgcG